MTRFDDKDTRNSAAPLYPSETLCPSDTLYPPLIEDVSNMIRGVETQKELLALNEELQQQHITPGELTTILQNCRARNIYAKDLGVMVRKVAKLITGFGVVGFKFAGGQSRKIVKWDIEEEDSPRRKRKHD
jgi:hypothetical protein